MKEISVRESFDYIEISETNQGNTLTLKEVEQFEKYIKSNKLNKDYILWERTRFRFINYVGFINFGNVYIEILPKSHSEGIESFRDERKALINMLRETRYINVKYSDLSRLDFEKENLLEIFAYLLSEKLKNELSTGLYKEYININENLSLLKGKINLKSEIKNKSKKSIKVNCDYDDFSENNIFNKIFNSVALFLMKKVRSLRTIENFKAINMMLSDVEVIEITPELINRIIFNRNNQRFYECFVLIKKLIFGHSALGKKGKNEGFSLLFEMQELYERYIGKIVVRIDENTKLQDTSRKLLVNSNTNRFIFQLRPDIVTENIIIDTKWKVLNDSNRHGVAREDLYQMYAYITRYKDVKEVILLYPLISNEYKNGEILESWHLEDDINKKIKVVTIDYTNNEVCIEGLRKVIKK